jgi:CheY-like chemotaxis protein
MIPGFHSGRPPSFILIVDDDSDNRQVLEIILGREGYRIATAATGQEALMSVARAVEAYPDLIMLDLMMPDMSGCQVAITLKSEPATARIPLMMLTAMTDQATRTRARNAGIDDFIAKPVDRIELCARVRKALGVTT